MTRVARLCAPLMMALALVAGCSGDAEPSGGARGTAAGAPVDATTTDYCAATDSLAKHVMSAMTDRDELMAGMKKWAAEMVAVGTPKTFSEQERAGFEQTIGLLRSLDPQLDAAALVELEADQSEAEKAAGAAFDAATVELCGSPLDNVQLPEIPTPAS